MRKRDDRDLVTTSVILEKQQVERLEALAAAERRSRSFVLRDAVALFLELRERQGQAAGRA